MEREIIEQYKNQIYNIAKKISYNDRDDLFQVGCLGLIKAYRNFDSNKDVKLFSYAYKYIIGEIKAYIRENRNIKISRELYTLCGKIEDARNLISQKLLRNPTMMELAMFLEMDINDISMALMYNYNTTSLDKMVCLDNDTNFYEIIPNIENLCHDDLILLKESINNLDTDDKKLINLRYVNDFTQVETAKIMGMSQVQVSRKESKVLKKMYQEIA